jgi:hypothetical protein
MLRISHHSLDRAFDDWISMLLGIVIAVTVWIAVFSLVPR